MEIDRIWLATLTKDIDDAGTDAGILNLVVNIDGEDVLDKDLVFMRGTGPLSSGLGPDEGWLDDGQVGLSDHPLETPIETTRLNNSSIRLGLREDDAWAPEQVFVFGSALRQVIPMAIEMDISRWLSTDGTEGKLTMPVRLVGVGTSSTVIRRVMLLVYTESGNSDSEEAIEFQISANGSIVMTETIANSNDSHLAEYTANWHIRGAAVPFTRGDVLSNGKIELSISGDDAWKPKTLFMFGFDTAFGHPNEVVTLVSIPNWDLGWLSTDVSEGEEAITLPVV
jgi:hypothetical protein